MLSFSMLVTLVYCHVDGSRLAVMLLLTLLLLYLSSDLLPQMPQSLQFEPLKLSGGSVLTLPAGSTVPETSISVLNGSKAKIVKALLAGRRHHLEVVRAWQSHL